MSLDSLMRSTAGLRAPKVGRQLFWFAIVGGSGVVGFVVLSSLMIALRTGLPNWAMSVLCYAALIVPVYLAHRRFSFVSSLPHAHALPRYVAVQVSALGLTAAFSFLCYSLLGLPTILGASAVALCTAAVNFVVLKLWAFAAPS